MNCKIRDWKIEDAEQLAEALNNKKIQDNLRDGLPLPYTAEDARGFINAMLDADKNSTFPFAITCEDRVVGSIGAFRKENIHFRTAEIGYYIAEDYWGQGLGTSALRKICEQVFSTTDIVRIFAEPFARNIASCRILEKAGFELEGTLKKNAFKNEIYEDMKVYALIKK